MLLKTDVKEKPSKRYETLFYFVANKEMMVSIKGESIMGLELVYQGKILKCETKSIFFCFLKGSLKEETVLILDSCCLEHV